MRILHESIIPPLRLQINYKELQSEHEVFGSTLSCSIPRVGDQVQSFEGPRFVITQVKPYGAYAFSGWCKEVK